MKSAIIGLLLLTISFQSCVVSEVGFCAVNNEETIEVNDNGTGQYSLKLDLDDFISKVPENTKLEMFKQFRFDTLILFDNFLTDTTLKLTEEERNMFRGGSSKIKIDIARKQETVLISLLYTNLAQLEFEREHIFNFVTRNGEFAYSIFAPKNDIDDVTKELLSKLGFVGPKIDFSVTTPIPEATVSNLIALKGFNPVGRSFSLKIADDSIRNTFVNSSLFEKTISGNTELKEAQIKISELDKVFFKTTFITHKKIKSYRGPVENISMDKKTITFKSSFADILKKPETTGYFISF